MRLSVPGGASEAAYGAAIEDSVGDQGHLP